MNPQNKFKPKVFVILPSFLGQYQNCAKNRKDKFLRAVSSFALNDYINKHLVIISDGCEITNSYEDYLKKFTNVTFLKIDKQPKFSGNVRQVGLDYATNNSGSDDIVCYLDSDDVLKQNHLSNIVKSFEDNDFVYYNDYLYYSKNDIRLRNVKLEKCQIGTSNIAHKILPNLSWKDCDGYGHDWTFIEKMMSLTDNYAKIYGCGYIVMHIPKLFDN